MCYLFFMRKTPYVVRMRGWSSEVCSSDLVVGHILEQRLQLDLVSTVEREMLRDLALADRLVGLRNEVEDLLAAGQAGRNIRAFFHCPADISAQIGRASCRERVCQYV